jgi:hypothetical protein
VATPNIASWEIDYNTSIKLFQGAKTNRIIRKSKKILKKLAYIKKKCYLCAPIWI